MNKNLFWGISITFAGIALIYDVDTIAIALCLACIIWHIGYFFRPTDDSNEHESSYERYQNNQVKKRWALVLIALHPKQDNRGE